MPRQILVASYSTRITTLAFDAATSPPSLSVVSSLEVGHKPSWITPHVTDPSVVFTANEQEEGVIKALKFDLNTGQGEIVAEAYSGGGCPCHLATSDNDLMAANYSTGSVGIITLLPSFPYLSTEPSQVIPFEGSGPIVSRQEASHPHQVLVHPTRKEILIPDLGADKIWRLQKEGSKWFVKGQVHVVPGGGPRHVLMLGETLYTLLELSNTLTSHDLPSLPQQPVAINSVATLSNPPQNPTTLDPPPLVAEILSPPVTPAYPIHFIYVTNRNDPGSQGDIISIFEIGTTGASKLIKEIPTGLNHLRGIAFDEEGRYLIAGGTFGGGVKMFERVNGGRDLREIAHLEHVEKPTGFHWLASSHID